MAISQETRNIINNAWADAHPCLLVTIGKDGANIGPKGSMVVYDDQHLAYWERTKNKTLDNLRHDNRVVVYYANMPLQQSKTVPSAFLKFTGTAEVHEDGPIKDKIFSMLTKREQEHEGADVGFGVLIKIEEASNHRGSSLL